MSQLQKLFEPIKIGQMEVKNRVAMSPIETGYTMEQFTNFYAERARGEVGLIICALRAYIERRDYKLGPELRRLADTCHAYGAKIAGQIGLGLTLWHKDSPSTELLGPSDVALVERRPRPKPMTLEDIGEFTEGLAIEAERVREAGFDAVDIAFHIASLLNQFFSPLTNKRTDQYGGSIENRGRLLMEVISRIRKRVGEDFPIMVRISGSDFMEGGYGLNDVKVVAPMIEKAGANFLTVTYGWHESPVPNFQIGVPQGAWIYLAEAIKKLVNIPVMGGCKVSNPLLAEEILRQGRVDMVFMARPLMVDPELLIKAKEGRFEDIRPCIGCCRCVELITVDPRHLMVCTMNPRVGREAELVIEPAGEPKKVAIIGGGPAGMQAALTATSRGHRVTLYENSGTLGGNLVLASAPPHKEEVKDVLNYLINQTQKSGAEIRLGEEASAKSILDSKPDAVIVATGATPIMPDIPGADRYSVIDALEVLSQPANIAYKIGYRVIIIGGGLIGCETAEFLAFQGRQVTILEMLGRMANDVYRPLRWPLMQRLRKAAVRMETNAKAEEITDSGVRVIRNETSELFEGDTVVLAVGLQSNNKLVKELEGKVALYPVGDCVEPQRVAQAIEGGMLAAMKV